LSSDLNHSEILRSGPKVWNAWRETNPSTIPDLAGVALKLSERQMGPANGGPINLKSARLQDAFLRFATLSTADLEAANLSGADLVHARFGHANLSAANLSNALLDHADFARANLTKVNLCGASLRFATLSGADLEAANMSSADLVHARFDEANLSNANLSNALLDHADFAGANLTKVNLCGASLYYAQNLTPAQLEESTGSDSTILPPHLREIVSWSVARSQTGTMALEPRDLPRSRHATDVDIPHITSYPEPVWRVGVLLIGGALVVTGFVWWHLNEAVPVDTSHAQTESEPPKLLDPGDQGLRPADPEELTEDKGDAERRPSVDAKTPPMPSTASAGDPNESTPEQRPERSEEALGPSEKPPQTLEEGPEPKSNEASQTSAVSSTESPVGTSPHGTLPDLPAEASIPDSHVPSAAEPPAEAPAVNTAEPSAALLNDTPTPSVGTVAMPSSVDQKNAEPVLPQAVERPPKPVRKPVIEKGDVDSKPGRNRHTKGQSFVDKKNGESFELNNPEHSAESSSQTLPLPVVTAALPLSAEQKSASLPDVPPLPLRKPVMRKSEVNAKPDRAKSLPKPVEQPVIQKSKVDSKPDRNRRVKDQSFVDTEAEQRPGSGSIADLLAGGL
jgi:hypothetical protein